MDHTVKNNCEITQKKITVLPAIWLVLVMFICTSCATLLGGQKTDHQRHKPQEGEPKREIRVGFVILDVVLTGGTGLLIDFATKKIYKRFPNEKHLK